MLARLLSSRHSGHGCPSLLEPCIWHERSRLQWPQGDRHLHACLSALIDHLGCLVPRCAAQVSPPGWTRVLARFGQAASLTILDGVVGIGEWWVRQSTAKELARLQWHHG